MYASMALCLACLLTGGSVRPLMKMGEGSYMRHDYDGAVACFGLAWAAAQQLPAEHPARYDVLKRLTGVHRAKGEFEEADRFLAQAIAWRESTYAGGDSRLAEDMIEEIALYRAMREYDRAMAVLRRVMELDTARAHGEPDKAVADDYSRMAQIYIDQKMADDAVAPLNMAIYIRTSLAGPLDVSLVPDLDRLGEVYNGQRAYDNAEYIYRQVLVIRESVYGKVHADLMATVDGLAYACFGQKKYDQAEALYQRLLDLWISSVGKDHPMVAIALDKVAVFYAEQKKFDQAKDAADRANAIRALSMANGLELEATQQFDAGHVDTTKALLNRAVKVVEPPDPIYDGVHNEISKILASLAKK